MLRSAAAALLLLLVPVSDARAACDLALRSVERGDATLALEWNRVTGARGYEVRESQDGFRTSTNTVVFGTTFPITRRASAPLPIRYRVEAQIDTGALAVSSSRDVCADEIEVTLPVDVAFRRMTRKAVIPIAGGGAGAEGSRFTTKLDMTATTGDQRGRVVFHPFGRPAREDDPSVAYRFGGVGEHVTFDDLAKSLGVTGFGSVDIVPDDDAAPVVPSLQVRIDSASASGINGGYVPAVFPIEYLTTQSVVIPIDDASFRTNIGVRTFSDVVVKALVYSASGRLRAIRDLTFPAEYSVMKPASDFVGDVIRAGDRVVLLLDGSVVVFYTATRSGSNDPSVIVAPPRAVSGEVGSYIR